MRSNYPCSLWYVLECCCYCTFFEVQFLVIAILVWTCLTVFFLESSSKYYIVTSCGYFRCRVDASLAVVRPSQNPDLHFRWSDPNVFYTYQEGKLGLKIKKINFSCILLFSINSCSNIYIAAYFIVTNGKNIFIKSCII